MNRIEDMVKKLCPNGIEFKRIGEIAECYAGATPKTTVREFWDNGTIPWMSSGEVNYGEVFATEKKITQLGYDKSSTKLVPPNTVVIALAGQGKTRGTVAITRIELCTNQSLCSIVTNDTLIVISSIIICVQSIRTSANILWRWNTRRTKFEMIANYVVPVPPLAIQNEIVDILDKFTALEAELEAELEARRKQYEYYRDKLLTFSKLPPPIKNEVKWLTMSEIATLRAGKAIAASEIEPFITDSKKYPCFGGNGIRGYVASYNRDGEYPVIGRQGALCGNVCFAKNKFYATEHAVVVACNKEVDSKYMYYVLVNANLNQYKTEGAQPGLSVEKLNRIKFAVPPLAEQQRIVAILDKFETLVNDISEGLPAEIAARRQQYEYYRDKLLTFKRKENAEIQYSC